MTELDLQAVCREVGEWAEENFGAEQPKHFPLFGIGEEIGELTTSVLKRAQGIDDADKYQGRVGDDAERDAIGDIVIYLMDYTYRSEVDPANLDPEHPQDSLIQGMDEEASTTGVPTAMYATFVLYGTYAELIEAELNGRDTTGGVETLIEFCTLFCEARGYDFDQAVQDALDEVLDREWDADVRTDR